MDAKQYRMADGSSESRDVGIDETSVSLKSREGTTQRAVTFVSGPVMRPYRRSSPDGLQWPHAAPSMARGVCSVHEYLHGVQSGPRPSDPRPRLPYWGKHSGAEYAYIMVNPFDNHGLARIRRWYDSQLLPVLAHAHMRLLRVSDRWKRDSISPWKEADPILDQAQAATDKSDFIERLEALQSHLAHAPGS